MLSSGAFNALLKTLEEPPQHVIFILATTEPQKVPLTIISRCQSFEFKSIPRDFMFDKLNNICKEENININEDAIYQICECSNGGLRDAIGLLDQLNSYCDDKINEDDVLLLSGRISNDQIYEIFNLIKDNNLDSLFKISDQFNNDGKDFVLLCEDIVKYIKNEVIEYQINNNSKLTSLIDKDTLIKIIFEITDYINIMRNLKEKKIYFDLLIIKIYNLISKTNVRDNIVKTVEIKEKKVDSKKEEIKTLDEKTTELESTVETKQDIKENYKDYDELMNIRLNNILAEADKESLKEYLEFMNNLEGDLNNLDERKIYNLLLDCSIKAGSKDGIIITTSSNNILEELYESIKDIQDLFSNKLSKDIKVCFYEDDLWMEKRKIYITRIRNKEKIELLDESEIINKINKRDSKEKNDFEDLLEIGE